MKHSPIYNTSQNAFRIVPGTVPRTVLAKVSPNQCQPVLLKSGNHSVRHSAHKTVPASNIHIPCQSIPPNSTNKSTATDATASQGPLKIQLLTPITIYIHISTMTPLTYSIFRIHYIQC